MKLTLLLFRAGKTVPDLVSSLDVQQRFSSSHSTTKPGLCSPVSSPEPSPLLSSSHLGTPHPALCCTSFYCLRIHSSGYLPAPLQGTLQPPLTLSLCHCHTTYLQTMGNLSRLSEFKTLADETMAFFCLLRQIFKSNVSVYSLHKSS